MSVSELMLLDHHLHRNSSAELCSCLSVRILGVKLQANPLYRWYRCTIWTQLWHLFHKVIYTCCLGYIYVHTLSCLLSWTAVHSFLHSAQNTPYLSLPFKFWCLKSTRISGSSISIASWIRRLSSLSSVFLPALASPRMGKTNESCYYIVSVCVCGCVRVWVCMCVEGRERRAYL